MSALNELIEAVERGHIDPSQYHLIPEVLGEAASGWRTTTLVKWIVSDAFEAMSAARALHEAVLPEWSWTVDSGDGATVEDRVNFCVDYETGDVPNKPARAWLLAILKALASREAQQ